MSLIIRDPEIVALAEELQRLTRARSRSDAVRRALQSEIAAVQQTVQLSDRRLSRALALADAMGPSDHRVDLKRVMDEMWGE